MKGLGHAQLEGEDRARDHVRATLHLRNPNVASRARTRLTDSLTWLPPVIMRIAASRRSSEVCAPAASWSSDVACPACGPTLKGQRAAGGKCGAWGVYLGHGAQLLRGDHAPVGLPCHLEEALNGVGHGRHEAAAVLECFL